MFNRSCSIAVAANGLPLAVSGGLEKTDFRLTTKFNNMHRPDEYPIKPPLQQTAVSGSSIIDVYHLTKLKERWEYLIAGIPNDHEQVMAIKSCINDLDIVLRSYCR